MRRQGGQRAQDANAFIGLVECEDTRDVGVELRTFRTGVRFVVLKLVMGFSLGSPRINMLNLLAHCDFCFTI